MGGESKAERTTATYARRLFNNVYNYTLLGGFGMASVLSGDWWLMAVGAGLEVLWMLYAPDSTLVRRQIDRAIDREDEEAEAQRRDLIMQRMNGEDRTRCRLLMLKQAEITRLAKENPSFGTDLLAPEIAKLAKLVASFIELTGTAARYTQYLDKEDIGDVERQRRAYEKEVQDGKGPGVDLAKKNLDIVLRRLERLKEITEFVERARRQMELIENSFALLADQIVSMQSPQALSGQLNDLMDGVEAIRETAREADRLVGDAQSA